MEKIPQDLVDRMMIKCARRCCICRRFNPTKLQAHHIKPINEGGTNDEDNLIVTCITCHVDVHSQVPFTRRFSYEELKGHRDTLIKMLEEGKLPKDEPENNQIITKVIKKISEGIRLPETGSLSPEAVQLLLAAAHTTGIKQGEITVTESCDGLVISPGDKNCPYQIGDRRAEAKYRAALNGLLNENLIEKITNVTYRVTEKGYRLADEIASSQGQSSIQEEH